MDTAAESGVDEATVSRARAMWEELAGGRFPQRGGVRVVETTTSRLCPPGWAGIMTFGGAVLATAPTAAQVGGPVRRPGRRSRRVRAMAGRDRASLRTHPPDHRGRGHATRVAAVATADALAAGLLPQWRARVRPSLRVADKLGYRVLGEQRSLRLE